MKAVFDRYKDAVDAALGGYFNAPDVPHARLLEAMRYSLTAGGKRIRPILTLEFCRACGGNAELAMPVACAVEMLHTYSLIHDDLPCMDDDELRRGLATNHMVFGEATAVLAGDALQAEAFSAILSSPLPADIRAECARILAHAAGADGICGGQQLDMAGEGQMLSEAELMRIHSRKTAALIETACLMGCVCARADDRRLAAAGGYARAVGMAFQIRDDMLDCTSTTGCLGKPVGSDAGNSKTTFATLLGLEKCAELVEKYTRQAKEALSPVIEDSEFLRWMADMLAGRLN